MNDDLYLAAPAIPAANTSATWVDTADGTFKGYAGLVGDLVFDEDVTLLIETAPEPEAGQPVYRVMNNAGAGDVIPADTPTEVRVGFLGPNTRVRIAVGAAVPTVWHVNGALTKDPVG